MDLRLTDISLTNFRNYRQLTLQEIDNLTIFVGRNAVGKTNLLEAIELCTALTSFRHPPMEQLVTDGEDFSRLTCKISDGDRLLELAAVFERGKRRYSLNGNGRNVADLKGMLPAVMFTPDDLNLAKKSSGVKRDAIDDLGAQLSKNYYVVKHDYDKVIRYKNRLLKDEAPDDFVLSINETLVTCASQLECYRVELFKRLSLELSKKYGEISLGEELTVKYLPSWDKETPLDLGVKLERSKVADELSAALARCKNEEQRRRRSVIGPYGDQIELSINGRNVSDFASQGQQRSVSLAWKLAEVAVIEESLGQSPVLLLDDVMSELDETRRRALIDSIEEDVQTFITTTSLSYFDDELLSRACVVELPVSEPIVVFG